MRVGNYENIFTNITNIFWNILAFVNIILQLHKPSCPTWAQRNIMSPKPISWWSDYLTICLDIRISLRSYLAATCPSDRSQQPLSLPATEPQPEPQSRNCFGQAKHFNSLLSLSLSLWLEILSWVRSIPVSLRTAGRTSSRRVWKVLSVWLDLFVVFLSWTMENYETCFKSFTIDPKSNQSYQPCRRDVLTSSIALSPSEHHSFSHFDSLSPA